MLQSWSNSSRQRSYIILPLWFLPQSSCATISKPFHLSPILIAIFTIWFFRFSTKPLPPPRETQPPLIHFSQTISPFILPLILPRLYLGRQSTNLSPNFLRAKLSPKSKQSGADCSLKLAVLVYCSYIINKIVESPTINIIILYRKLLSNLFHALTAWFTFIFWRF